jgi:hypothetical protein
MPARVPVPTQVSMPGRVPMPCGRMSPSVAVSCPAMAPEPAERHRDQANGAEGKCSEVEIHRVSRLKGPSASAGRCINASRCRPARNNPPGASRRARPHVDVVNGRTKGPRREKPRSPGVRLRFQGIATPGGCTDGSMASRPDPAPGDLGPSCLGPLVLAVEVSAGLCLKALSVVLSLRPRPA